MTNCAGKILASVAIEFMYARMRGEEPDIVFAGKTSGRPLKDLAVKLLSQ